jgi:hypothetical protein
MTEKIYEIKTKLSQREQQVTLNDYMPITKDTPPKNVYAQEYGYLKNTCHVTVLHITAIAVYLLELTVLQRYSYSLL